MAVLLIDDNPAVFRLISHLAQMTGSPHFTLLHAETVEDGLDMLAARRFDVVLLDNRVPPHDRFEVPLDLIRRVCDVPVVLLTGTDLESLGYDDVPDVLNGYLSKNDLSPGRISDVLSPYLGVSANKR